MEGSWSLMALFYGLMIAPVPAYFVWPPASLLFFAAFVACFWILLAVEND